MQFPRAAKKMHRSFEPKKADDNLIRVEMPFLRSLVKPKEQRLLRPQNHGKLA
jgi:hypothetical protein